MYLSIVHVPVSIGKRAEWGYTAKERRMSEWFFKSCIKFSICSVVLFFFYHLFITQKLDEEVSTHSKEQE
jgi:hypothetical protein